MLEIVAVVAAASGALALWLRSRRRRGSEEPSSGQVVDLGNRFVLGPGRCVYISDLKLFTKRGTDGLLVVGTRRGRREEARLDELPLRFDRIEVRLVGHRLGRLELESSEAECPDEAFAELDPVGSEDSPCTPELPSFHWTGVRLAGPRNYVFSSNKPLTLAGVYRVALSALHGQPRAHFRSQASPRLVIVNERTGAERIDLVDHLYDAYLHRVIGLSISWAMAPEPEAPPPGSADTQIGANFYCDLRMAIEPPQDEEVYRVHAELGPHRSESIRIKVRP